MGLWDASIQATTDRKHRIPNGLSVQWMPVNIASASDCLGLL